MKKVLLLKCYIFLLLEEPYLALDIEAHAADRMCIYCLMRFMSVTREYLLEENKLILNKQDTKKYSEEELRSLLDPIEYYFDKDDLTKMNLYCTLFHNNSKKLTEMIKRTYNYSAKELGIKYKKVLKMKAMRHSYQDLVRKDYFKYIAKYRKEFRTIEKRDKEFISEILIIFDLLSSFVEYCVEINTKNLKTIITLFNKYIRTYLLEEVSGN